MNFSGALAIGFDDYKDEILKRSKFRGYTAFQNLDTFVSPEARPRQDMYATKECTFDMDRKFVDFLSVIKHWAGPPISGQSTESSESIRIYIPNFLFFKWFDSRFLVENGKIQLESGTIAIRCNINRKGYELWSKIEKVIGSFWHMNRENGLVVSSKSVENEWYWSEAIVPFLKKHKRNMRQITELKLRWDAIGQGYAPGYKVKQCNGLRDAASELPISVQDLLLALNRSIREKLYEWSFGNSKRSSIIIPHLIQCGGLIGRKYIICTTDQYLNILICHHCQNNKSAGVSVAEDNGCCDKGLIPLGKDVLVSRRNELSKSSKENVKMRDEQFDPPCLIGRVLKDDCGGDMVYCHVRSALETNHKLDAKDAFWGCTRHNTRQGAISLLDFVPEAKEEANKLGLRV